MRNSQLGVGLIEIMVALLLLAVAVMGFSIMQMSAIQATDDSMMRTRALTVMRGGVEMMRSNPKGIDSFKAALKSDNDSINIDGGSIDVDSCMPAGSPSDCTIKQLATREGIALRKYAVGNDLKIDVDICPGTSGVQQRQCLIASWGNTAPKFDDSNKVTYKSEALNSCATKKDGSYYAGAECFIMEAY